MSTQRMISAASGVIEAPDLWSSRLPSKFADLCPRLIETEEGPRWTAASKIATAPAYAHMFGDAHGHEKPLTLDHVKWLATAEGRRWIQDEDDVQGEVLYSTGQVWDLINASDDSAFTLACYQAYNDWLGELCAADPERFTGIAKVPTTGVDDAVAEVKRAAGELGLKGLVLDAWPGGPECPPAMQECDPFWEAASGLGLPVSIYRPLNGGHEPDYAVAAGVYPEYYNDFTTIIYANIPDRHPDIRFVSLAPNAGWAPPAYEQLSDTYMRTSALRKISLGNPDLYPSDYLRRFFWYVTQDDRTSLLNANYFGEAHLLWGSFAFLDNHSVWPNTRQLYNRLSGGMSPKFLDALAQSNTSRLYGIGNASRFSPEEINAYDSYALI